jgi:hypothetical protein
MLLEASERSTDFQSLNIQVINDVASDNFLARYMSPKAGKKHGNVVKSYRKQLPSEITRLRF